MENGMILIKEDKYGKILDQLNEVPYNTLFARAVLELKSHGMVLLITMRSLGLFLLLIHMVCHFSLEILIT